MKPSPAYEAVAELERRSAVRLSMICSEMSRLSRNRHRIVAGNAAARRLLAREALWTSLACYALAAHTTWSASAASDIAAVQRLHVVKGSALAAERLHWARCRRGLERRALKASSERPKLWDRPSWLV